MNLIGLRVRMTKRFRAIDVQLVDRSVISVPVENIASIILVEKPQELMYTGLVVTTNQEIYLIPIRFENFEIIDDQPG